MACSDEVLEAAKAIVETTKVKEFTIEEVREYMAKRGSQYTDNTIRGQIVSVCNADSPKHRFPYFRKVKGKRGTYKLA